MNWLKLFRSRPDVFKIVKSVKSLKWKRAGRHIRIIPFQHKREED